MNEVYDWSQLLRSMRFCFGIPWHRILNKRHFSTKLSGSGTGVVVECKPFDQYVIKVHGSNRLTLRNRRFVRSYDPPAGLDK